METSLRPHVSLALGFGLKLALTDFVLVTGQIFKLLLKPTNGKSQRGTELGQVCAGNGVYLSTEP